MIGYNLYQYHLFRGKVSRSTIDRQPLIRALRFARSIFAVL
jgi:hypothetical protein